jgi:myo-inositol 2-dehydrogenase / D-chiro-inositol 1-dehydrogenase
MASSPTRPSVRIGIVGCGRAAGSLHLPALARVRGAAVTALSDVDSERLAQLASRCPGASAYPDYRAMLDDERVDLVAVCVPVTRHAEIAAAALRSGKHLFVEKPLALELEECDRLVELAKEAEASGRRSVVGFNLRSHRLVRRARAIIRSGELGEIELVRTLWTADWSGRTRPAWHASREQGGGALLEIGTHQADLWRWLLDSEVETVHADTRSSAFDDQSATMQVRMAGGVLVIGAVSQRSVSHNLVEVLGSRGSLSLSCYHGDSLTVAAGGSPGTGLSRRIGPLVAKAAQLPGAFQAARGGGDFRMSYVREWENVIGAIASGGPAAATLHDGRQAAAVLHAALRSVKDGRAAAPVPPPVPIRMDATVA